MLLSGQYCCLASLRYQLCILQKILSKNILGNLGPRGGQLHLLAQGHLGCHGVQLHPRIQCYLEYPERKINAFYSLFFIYNFTSFATLNLVLSQRRKGKMDKSVGATVAHNVEQRVQRPKGWRFNPAPLS